MARLSRRRIGAVQSIPKAPSLAAPLLNPQKQREQQDDPEGRGDQNPKKRMGVHPACRPPAFQLRQVVLVDQAVPVEPRPMRVMFLEVTPQLPFRLLGRHGSEVRDAADQPAFENEMKVAALDPELTKVPAAAIHRDATTAEGRRRIRRSRVHALTVLEARDPRSAGLSWLGPTKDGRGGAPSRSRKLPRSISACLPLSRRNLRISSSFAGLGSPSIIAELKVRLPTLP